MLNLEERSRLPLSPAIYGLADVDPLDVRVALPSTAPRQYVLRMPVRTPDTNGFLVIPPELEWLRSQIEGCQKVQRDWFADHDFCYVTVRSGPVTSTTDDVWHVDGFSMRFRHLPEMDYIASDHTPTEYLDQRFALPSDFDGLKHNVHLFFQDRADETNVKTFEPGKFYAIDPYIVHRRPRVIEGDRVMVRISFIPLEIEDDRNTPNPLLPTRKYGRGDVRDTLQRY